MTARIALASLVIVPAAMAYPWRSTGERWLLGIVVVAVFVLFAWWRGAFATTLLRRRLNMWCRRTRSVRSAQPTLFTAVLLQVDGQGEVPVSLIASYLDRYGVRCDKIRITSRDLDGVRTRWIGLTLGAVDNLDALRARSPRIPLQETAEAVGRRLAAHLRETGWDAGLVGAVEGPVRPGAKEKWCGMRDTTGYFAAYRAGSLQDLSAMPVGEMWTALEISGTAADLRTTAVCAIRTQDKPVSFAGAIPLNGRHRAALDALNPMSTQRISAVIGT
ncbi:type VII secretion protein EccE [Mycobacterium sp. NPDC048908]|uniref:type VII secretion protein EccE n=1 Tax=Mycobacterium sp. NPDC048908 TaxID=3364292 RepID=UPI00371DCAEC